MFKHGRVYVEDKNVPKFKNVKGVIINENSGTFVVIVGNYRYRYMRRLE